MEKENLDLIKLESQAYRVVAQIEQLQRQLAEINNAIRTEYEKENNQK